MPENTTSSKQARHSRQLIFLRAVVALLAAYLTMHILVIWFQDHLIFIPSQSAHTPPPPDSSVSSVAIPTPDNGVLSGWWVHSPQEPIGLALVYCHGNGATLEQLHHVAPIFRDLGVHTLLFDYRGYGASSSTEISEESLAADARSAFDWVKTQVMQHHPEVRGVVVWGHSLGGAVAARLSTERPVTALITEGVFASIQEMARVRYPFLVFPRATIRNRFEVSRFLAERRMPLMMIHAEKDTIIPVSEGIKAFQAARQPKRFLRIPTIGHNDFPSVEAVYRAEIRAFLKSALHSSSITSRRATLR